MAEQLTTWEEFRRDLAQAYENASAAYDHTAGLLMHGARLAYALAELADALAEARDNLDRLVGLAIRFSPPSRPLEAVLADIRAEGHRICLYTPNADGFGHVSSWRLDRKQTDEDAEHGDEYLREHNGNLVAMLEKRLADIRKLHAESADPEPHIVAGADFVRIEDGQTGRWVYGFIEGTDHPHGVFDRQPDCTTLLVASYLTEESARAVAAEMNGAADLWIATDEDPEVQPVPSTDEAAELAREERPAAGLEDGTF
jgi:hypothetical protein